MEKMDKTYISVQAIDNAYEEGTLTDLVIDYLVFGGDIADVYETVKQSSVVSDCDIDKAVEYMKENNIIVEDAGIPKDCDSCYDESIDNFKEDFEWMKDDSVLSINDISDIDDVDLSNVEMTTIGDLLANMMDNASDETIDDDIKLFKKIARLLDVRDYDSLVVCISDMDLSPDLVLSDRVELDTVKGRRLFYYESANMILEVLNGNHFMYFKTEDDAKRYIKLANKFMNYDELNQDTFGYDEKHAKEWAERHPYGYYNDEGDFGIEEDNAPTTIEEALNRLDMRTGNKFDLLNKFLSEKLSNENKDKLIEMLNSNADISKIHQHLVEAGGVYEDEEEEFKEFIMNEIRAGHNGEFSVKFMDPFAQQKIEKWLRFNKFEFESLGNELTVFLTNNKSTDDLKVDEAKKIRATLEDCIKILDDYISGKFTNESYFEPLYKKLSDATYDCRDYLIRG